MFHFYIIKTPLNAIIDGINGFTSSLSKIKVPDWVPGVGGKSINIPRIPRLKIGMDYVPSDMFPAYLDQGEWVLTKEEADYLRSFGGLEGLANRADSTAPGDISIIVQGGQDIDYKKLGAAVTESLLRAGVGFKCDDRVFARLIKDLIDYA